MRRYCSIRSFACLSLTALILAGGCGPMPSGGGSGTPGDPDIDVFPLSILFNEEDPDFANPATITINNNGDGVLTVSETNLVGSAAYSITSGGAPFTVAAGTTRTIEVTFGTISVDTEAAVLTIVSDDSDEGSIDVQLIGGASNMVDANIDVDRNFGDIFSDSSMVDYTIDGSIQVSGDITFAPGVIVEFEPGSTLVVQDSGSINIVGTADEPVVLTGTIEAAGNWRGINIFSNNPLNQIRFAEVRFGGSSLGSGQSVEANVYVQSSASLAISDTLIADGRGYGMAAENGAILTEFERNRFERNQEAPLRFPANLIDALDDDSTFMGENADEYIEVFDTTVQDATWRAQDVPYRFDGTTDIEGDVSVLPGFTAIFDNNAAIQVDDGGSLSAIGTADSVITFRGEVETAGQWRAINFFSNNPLNELTHCVIQHGGSSLGSGMSTLANVYLQSSGRLSLTNSRIESGGGAGFAAENGALIDEFEANSFAGNADAAVDIPATLASAMDSASTFSGSNGRDWVNVDGVAVTTDGTWSALDVPYSFEDNSTRIQANISIEPGASFAFAPNAGLVVEATGSLSADASSGDPILFTADTEVLSGTGTAGHWRSINVFSSSPSNVFHNVIIEFGGSGLGTGQSELANFYVQSSGSASLLNSISRNSAGWGAFVENSGTLTESGNTFSNNTLGDVGPTE